MATKSVETASVSPLEQYEKMGYNLLLPSKTIQKVSQFHESTMEVVQLSVKAEDVYPQDHYDPARATKFSISKTGLMKLSHAAGLQWNWQETKRIDPMTNPDYVAYQAVGALQRGDGRWLPFKASYEVDLRVTEEELRQGAEGRAKAMRGKGQLKNDNDEKDWIDSYVRKELLRARKHKLRKAETGAILAAVRALLGIRSTYNRQDLEKPFVVPRVVFKPDLTDPDIRKAVILGSMKSVAETFGGPESFSAPANPADVIQIPQSAHDPEDDEPPRRSALTQIPEKFSPPEPDPAPSEELPPDPDNSAEPEPDWEVPIITSVDDLQHIADGAVPDAIRKLMKEKDYAESLLKNRLIETWSVENQKKFVSMLLEKFPTKEVK